MSIIKFKNSINGEYQKVWTMKGKRGPQGEKGNPGHTPVKGTDYWIDEDKNRIVNRALETMYIPKQWCFCNGTQHINTGIIPLHHSVELVIEVTTTSGPLVMFGAEEGWRYYGMGMGGAWYIGRNGSYSSQAQVMGSPVVGQEHIIQYNYSRQLSDGTLRTGYVTTDGKSFAWTYEYISETPLYLFGGKGLQSDDKNFSGKVKYCIIKDEESGEIVRHFIPATDHRGRGCLYDIIQKKKYYSEGEGDFICI